MEDKDPSVVYDGPFMVMVNSNSASASEIMAAAIQDYHRGIIVGTSPSTFGKGTVQRFYDMDDYLPPQYADIKPIGQVKITTQKFYRVNGDATQLKGVIPDIILPDPYYLLDQGEKEQDYPMAWDEINPAQRLKAEYKKMENIDKEIVGGVDVVALKADAFPESDTVKVSKNKEWYKAIKKDLYLNETVQIMNEMK